MIQQAIAVDLHTGQVRRCGAAVLFKPRSNGIFTQVFDLVVLTLGCYRLESILVVKDGFRKRHPAPRTLYAVKVSMSSAALSAWPRT